MSEHVKIQIVNQATNEIYWEGVDYSEAMGFLNTSAPMEFETVVRFHTNGFVRDFWYGEFSRPQDYKG